MSIFSVDDQTTWSVCQFFLSVNIHDYSLPWPVSGHGGKIILKLYCSHSILQVPPLFPLSPVWGFLRIPIELWVSLWAGHWVVETVLITTWSTLLPMEEDFWTSAMPAMPAMPAFHCRQATSTTSQYMVSTVRVRRGVRVSPWQSLLKVHCARILHGKFQTKITWQRQVVWFQLALLIDTVECDIVSLSIITAVS